MEIFYNIKPRQSGKTTTCFEMWNKNPSNILLFMHDETYRTNIIEFFKHKHKNNIIRFSEINVETFRGLKHKNIIIDEYEMMSIKKMVLLNDVITFNDINNIFIYTSQNMLYIFEIVHLVNHLKKTNSLSNIKKFIELLYPKLFEKLETDIVEYYYHTLLYNKDTISYGKINFNRVKNYLNSSDEIHF